MSLPPDTGSVELTSYRQHTLRQLLQKGERPDRRAFDATRTPSVVREVHTSSSSSGSSGPSAPRDGLLSSVIYQDDGGTCVACAVHGVFGPPWPQRPNEGRLNVRVTAPFLQDGALAGFTTAGGHSNAAVASGLADFPLRQLEGFVRSCLAASMDLGQLLVYPAEACWVLTVTITLVNADGGLRAAALHAAVAALHGLVLPRALLPNGDIVEARPLRMRGGAPIASSFAVIARGGPGGGVALLADPTAIEENVADGLVTVALDAAGRLVDMQQTGEYPLTPAALVDLVDKSVKPDAARLRQHLLK